MPGRSNIEATVSDRSRTGGKGYDRILVIDPNAANARMMANLLRGMFPSCQIYGAATGERGMALARELNPQLVLVESKGPELDGVQFCRDLRRSEFVCREAPIVLVAVQTTAALILAARDAGVHEFLRRPYTMGDLQKRIDVVSGKPRDWIEAVNYIGPDRRRFNSAEYAGPRKRRNEGVSKTQRINQALRIMQSAVGAVDTDPVQAARALATQARILLDASAAGDDLKRLGAVATQLQAYLTSPEVRAAGPSRRQVEVLAESLISAAPADARPEPAYID